MDLKNKTAAVLGRRELWPGAMLTLSDNGGDSKMRVFGTGEVVVQQFLPERQERRYELRLAPEDVVWLFEQCIAMDILQVKPRPVSSFNYVPQISIFLQGVHGRAGGGHKRQGDKDKRFDPLYEYLLALQERVMKLEPTYSGRENRFYEPPRGLAGRYWRGRGKIESLRYAELADIPEWLLTHLPWRWIWFTLLIVLGFVIAYFYVLISSEQQYGFWSAMAHGFFVVQNGILSLFDGREVWAPLNTGWWYSIGYTVGMVLVPGFVRLVFEILVEVVRRG